MFRTVLCAERCLQKESEKNSHDFHRCQSAIFLIAKPGISVSTRTVYEKLDALTITEHPDIDGLITGLENQDLRAVASSMGNVLEQVTVDAYPDRTFHGVVSNISKKEYSSSSSSSSDSSASYSAPTSSNGQAVASYACQFVGNPYVYGGSSLTNGTDCSGFVMSVYSAFGIGLPHSSSALRGCGYE